MKKILQLQGLDCAGCAVELERRILKIEGVSSASISFVHQTLTVEYREEDILQKIPEVDDNFSFEELDVVVTKADEKRALEVIITKNRVESQTE